MAANIAVNDIIQCKVFCYMGSQVGINVHYFQCTLLTGTGATYDQAATGFDLNIGSLYKPILCNSASYISCHAQRIWPLPVLVASIGNANAGIGTHGVTALPTQVCAILTKKTGNAGRAYRGRTYLPFPDTTADTGLGVPVAAFLALCNTLAVSLSSTFTVGVGGNQATLIPVLYHRKTPGVPTPITSVAAVAKWATQRRRGSYGQTNAVPV